MAKNNNLTDFLKGIADKLRAKLGFEMHITTTPTVLEGGTFSAADDILTFTSTSVNARYSYYIPVEIGKQYTITISSMESIPAEGQTATGSEIFLSSVSDRDDYNYGILTQTILSKTITARTSTLYIKQYICYGSAQVGGKKIITGLKVASKEALELINPQDFETKIDDVYTQGKKDNNSEFWSAYAQNSVVNGYYTGNASYMFAGYGWNADTYTPTFNFKPTNVKYMFATNYNLSYPFKCSAPASADKPLLDTSNCTVMDNFLAGCNVVALPTIDTRKATNLNNFMSYSTVVTVDKLILKDDGSQSMSGFATGNIALRNITIEGAIGYSGLNFSSCDKLTHDSLLSIINALKDYSDSTTHTLVIHPTSLTLLSDTELALATAKNWSISVAKQSLYQFNGDANHSIKVTASQDCTILRCGKNLMYPVGNTPLVLNASSVIGTGIMRTANKGINQEILKHPRTYSFRVSENSISGTGGFMFQETTAEYKTGIVWINKGATTGKTYITDTTSTVTTYGNSAYYYARRTTTGESDSITIDQCMCALGNDAEYEPYNGNTYTATAGQTIEIDALDGVNTLICSAGTMTISYVPKTNTTEV